MGLAGDDLESVSSEGKGKASTTSLESAERTEPTTDAKDKMSLHSGDKQSVRSTKPEDDAKSVPSEKIAAQQLNATDSEICEAPCAFDTSSDEDVEPAITSKKSPAGLQAAKSDASKASKGDESKIGISKSETSKASKGDTGKIGPSKSEGSGRRADESNQGLEDLKAMIIQKDAEIISLKNALAVRFRLYFIILRGYSILW